MEGTAEYEIGGTKYETTQSAIANLNIVANENTPDIGFFGKLGFVGDLTLTTTATPDGINSEGATVYKNVETGTNDVDDLVSGYIRTDKATISFNGAWAQNLDEKDAYIDFLGDKGGARLTYGGQFKFTNGETLESYTTDHEIPQQHAVQDEAFIEAVRTGEKNRNYIDNILESMKLLDSLYKSAAAGKEIEV
jgi:predicted dehydrogenase